MSKLWRVVAVLALLAAGCRAEANIVLDVEEDGSGTFTAELGMDEQFQELLGAAQAFLGGGITLPGDIDISNLDELDQRVEGELTFFSTTTGFDDVEDLEQSVIDQVGQAATFDSFDLSVDEDGATLVAKLSLGGDDAFDPSQLPIDIGELESNFAASVIASLPGEIVQHNADEVIDGRLRWNIDIQRGVDIEARTSFGGSSFPVWVILVAVLIVLAAGGLLLYVNRERNRPKRAIEAVPAPPPPDPILEPGRQDGSLG